jgi:hypothetical protein
MRFLVLTGALACALCAAVYAEEDVKGKPASPAGQTVVFEEAGGSGEREIETGPARSRQPNDGGVDDAGVMPSYETYDDTTGLPDYVPSDSYGEVDE